MKTLRLWLLVLLAVLLPIRGAAAAAMLCPPTGSAGHMQTVVAEHHPAAAEHLVADGPDHDRMQHHHGQSGHHDHQKSSGSAEACNLCAAYCSVTPMLSSLPTVQLPLQVSTVTFPDLATSSPSHVSGGQDRPPRTI